VLSFVLEDEDPSTEGHQITVVGGVTELEIIAPDNPEKFKITAIIEDLELTKALDFNVVASAKL